MKKNDVKDVTTVACEGLEQRQFLSAAPMMHFAPPAFGDAIGSQPPIVFDAAFLTAGRFPQNIGSSAFAFDNQSIAVTSAVAAASTSVAPSAAFNGYPTSSTVNAVATASGSMELVNRAVDGDFVATDAMHSQTLSATTPTDTAIAPAAVTSTVVTGNPTQAASAAAQVLPDGQIAHPAAVFSSEPIRSDAGATGVSAVTASLRSAEEQIACVVRLAWADIAYTNVGQSISRLADEAGQALGRHAADAELAAAMVMGVAGAAWWVKQAEEDVVEKKIEAEHSWIETVYPRPLVG